LWDAFAEATERRINGRLLYCADGVERTVPRQDHTSERHILRARNQIVAAHQALARGDLERAMPHHGQYPERCADVPCRYRAERCAHESGLIGLGRWAEPTTAAGPDGPWEGVAPELVQAARDYYRHFARLVALEYLAESREQG